MNTPEQHDIEMENSDEGRIDMDPSLSALLDMLNGSGGMDPMAILLSRMGVQAENDPRTAQLLKFLEQQREQRIQRAEADEDEAWPEDGEYIDIENQADEELELRDLLVQASEELETLRLRNDALAASLGACHLCFGADPRCEACHGRGIPGYQIPEPAAFRQYVAPALSRIKSMNAKRQKSQARNMERPQKYNGEAHIASG